MQRLRLPGGGRGGGHGGPVKEYSKGTLDLSVMFSFFNKDDAIFYKGIKGHLKIKMHTLPNRKVTIKASEQVLLQL